MIGIIVLIFVMLGVFLCGVWLGIYILLWEDNE